MKIFTKKNLAIIGIIGTILCGSIFIISKNVKAIQPIDGISNGIDLLQNSLARTNSTEKKELLKNFCSAASVNSAGFTDGSLYYSPNYSLFLGVLCKPFGIDIFLQDNGGKTNYIADYFDKNWNILLGVSNTCDPETSMADCDIGQLLKTIFTAVMDDHSLLGMGSWAMSSNKTDDLIKDFSNTYFGDGKTLCKSPDTTYIGTKSIAGAEGCSHPQTYKYLQDVILGLQKNIQSLKIINHKNIQNIDKESADCSKTDNNYPNLFLCSYTSKKGDNKNSLQANLWYNELMYYRLLSKWLIMRFSNDTEGLGSVDLTEINNIGSKNAVYVNRKDILSLQTEMDKSKVALNIMQKSVANFQATFPLHVGLLAYYEDILSIRKSFVKIYTPLNQLYYTLRNVQSK